MLYILAVHPFSVLASTRMIRSALVVCSVPCQFPATSPRSWATLAGAAAVCGAGACRAAEGWTDAIIDTGRAIKPARNGRSFLLKLNLQITFPTMIWINLFVTDQKSSVHNPFINSGDRR